MEKLYGVTVFDGSRAIICFTATLEKARLRAHIHRLQGYRTTRPAFMPKMSRNVAEYRARGQIVAPSLRND